MGRGRREVTQREGRVGGRVVLYLFFRSQKNEKTSSSPRMTPPNPSLMLLPCPKKGTKKGKKTEKVIPNSHGVLLLLPVWGMSSLLRKFLLHLGFFLIFLLFFLFFLVWLCFFLLDLYLGYRNRTHAVYAKVWGALATSSARLALVGLRTR